MKVIILAAGQGTRLRPLTDNIPKCMVKINNKSIIQRQIETMRLCGISDNDIYIVTGYCGDKITTLFHDSDIHFIKNEEYETTNMVCSLMAAREVLENNTPVIISYGDIVYTKDVLNKIIEEMSEACVITDDGWYEYWKLRCSNPLDDAETLIKDEEGNLIEIGQKTNDISRIQSQYIGLIKFQKEGISKVIQLCEEAKKRSEKDIPLWRTDRNYSKMYMTDMLQGLVDEGNKIKAVSINRGWFEIDNIEDLHLAEKNL